MSLISVVDSRVALEGAAAFDLSVDANVSVRVVRWLPKGTAAAPTGVLHLVHGLSEHVGRWAKHAQWLADQLGFAVWAADHRGHGLSGGDRSHLTSNEQLLSDLVAVVAAIHAAHYAAQPLPTHLMGHSLGGCVSVAFLEFLADRSLWPGVDQSAKLPAIARYVLSAPAMVTDQAWLLQKLAPIAAIFAPTLRLSPAIQGEQLSVDEAVGKAYFADPLVTATLAVTTSFGKHFLAFMEEARAPHRLAALAASDMRGFVYHGREDTLVPIRASELLAQHIPHLTFVPLPNTRHEAQFEPVADDILAQVVAFLKK